MGYYSISWNGKPCNSYKEIVEAVTPGVEAVFHKYSELHIAARAHWPIKKCKEIIAKNGHKIIGKKTTEGDTALHLAAKYNNKEICELLVPKMTFDLIKAWNNEGKTALLCAENPELQDLLYKLIIKKYHKENKI